MIDYGDLTLTEIGNLFNVKIGAISHIKTGRNWKHIKQKEIV